MLPAFILAGILFNLHALTAAYLVFMFALCCVWPKERVVSENGTDWN